MKEALRAAAAVAEGRPVNLLATEPVPSWCKPVSRSPSMLVPVVSLPVVAVPVVSRLRGAVPQARTEQARTEQARTEQARTEQDKGRSRRQAQGRFEVGDRRDRPSGDPAAATSSAAVLSALLDLPRGG